MKGVVDSALGNHLVVDVSGVGYGVQVTPEYALSLHAGDEIKVLTAFVVREDAQTLFGFETEQQRELFDILRAVNGVGPKTAMATLSKLSATDIVRAVQTEDFKVFQSVPGIGPKSAKLITVQLAGRLANLDTFAGPGTPVTGDTSEPDAASAEYIKDVTTALVGLGWVEKQANEVVGEIARNNPAYKADQLLRTSLVALAKTK